MKLQLERPIAFIDIESTGTNREEDRIVEISMCKLYPSLEMDVKTRRVNPGIAIPTASTEVHGIRDEDVANEPGFKQIAKALHDTLLGCDIGGFNSNAFDVPLLYNEFLRAGIAWNYKAFAMIDVGNIFKINEPRTLAAALKFYCNTEIENAHSAEADIKATVDVFLAQLEKYELPDNVNELALYSNYGKPVLDLSGKFSTNDKNEIILNFGKYKGEPALNHTDFLEWMYYKASFAPDTNAVCAQLLFGNFEHPNDDEENPFD